MYLKTVPILACFLILFLPSCKNNKPSLSTEPEIIRIDVEAKGPKLLPIDVKAIVPLETNTECQWSYVAKFQYYKNRVYILNNNRFESPGLFMFDSNGRFLKKTTNGKGPGETISPFAFTIDPIDSSILLYDQLLGASLIFDLDLKYIRTEKYPRVFIEDLYQLGKDSFLVYHQAHLGETDGVFKCATYSVYSGGFKNEKHLDIFLYGKHPGYGLVSPFSKTGSDLFFISPLSYNIYRYDNGRALTAYTIDFGNAAVPQKELDLIRTEFEMYPLFKGDKIWMLGGIYFTKNYIGIITYCKNKSVDFFQSRKSKAVYPLTQCFDAGILPECRIYGVTEDETFYALADPEQMIKYQEKTGKMKDVVITENDNPYLILFKLTGK
jgi:hypothetical protein